MTCLKDVWAWLKKWGPWVVFPVGLAYWFLTRNRKTEITVSSPELMGHQEVRERIDTEAQKKISEAAVKRDERRESVEEHYAEVSKRLDAAEERRAEALKNDPDALNRYLKEVGHAVRNQSKDERR